MATIVVLLLVALSVLAPVIFAAGEDIRVVSSGRKVQFPAGVLFDLKLESEADILEVRLYYRVRPSGAWTYAYPNLTPSRRVETSFNLKISGVSYLPPGTELEYYYSIRDAQGNTLKTRPEIFVYVDNRFRWETIEAGPLTLYWHSLSKRRVREVARQVEQSLFEIGRLLEVSLDEPVRGIIYNSRSEAREAFPHQSQTTTQEQVFQGFAFPDRGVFVGVGMEPRLIVHESAHLLLGEAISSPLAKVPAWVNEGFASYVEPAGHGGNTALLRGASPDLIPLRHMYSVPGRPEDIRYFYRKAEGVVGHLLEAHGVERFRAFVAQLNRGKDVDKALIEAYGFDLEGLDQRWALDLGQRGVDEGGNGSIPFSYINFPIIAILLLVVMGVLATSYIARRLRKSVEGPEEWDRLTEVEWQDRP